MPNVALAKVAPLIVTADELTELADWERKYAEHTKHATAAEKELKFRRIALAEKVLGVKSSDELKRLSPKQVERRFNERLETGEWKAERGAPAFSFLKTHQGSYPAWKDLYVKLTSETAAAEISADTPVTYSYRVDVTLP